MNRNRHFQSMRASMALALALSCASVGTANALTPSDVPLANIDAALSNVVLALSVEFPTGDTASYGNRNGGLNSSAYDSATTYYGYFDPAKCYIYVKGSPVTASNTYFKQAACNSSPTPTKGNFLNWAAMTNLDQFRRIMTGGSRLVDTATQTILQRGFTDTQMGTGGGNYFPDKTARSADAGPLGSSGSTYAYKNASLGDKMLVQSGSSVTITNLTAVQMATQDCATLATTFSTANATKKNGTTTYPTPPWSCYHIRAEVCTTASPESNCTKYGSNYKPEGLMQKYNTNMRFSAFGYLLENSNARQGGVLRARMKSVGPTIQTALTSTTNPAYEWSATDGTYRTNPDTADASATGVSNSGVMNYLNKFGFNGVNNNGIAYKGYDPVAELYYEALRYLRGMNNTATPVANMTSAMYDGFPVIRFDGTAANDPVISACQKNFIITIGDVNCWCDTRLPGGKANCGGTVPIDTGGVVTTGVDFGAMTDRVSIMENAAVTSPTLNATKDARSGLNSGYFLDGMAWWAHVNDIRPDKAANRQAGTIQNVTSFFIDVLEPWNGVPSSQMGTARTQFWLAAKYGGFDLSLTDQTSATTRNNPNTKLSGNTAVAWDNAPNSLGVPVANGVPDNWFPGNDPVVMQAGLSAAFDKIAAAGTTGNGGAGGASGVSLATAKKIYYAGYTLENSGRGWLKSCAFAISAADCVGAKLDWDAAQWLSPSPTPSTQYTAYQSDAADANTTPPTTKRAIITRSGGVGVEFLLANLASGDKVNLAYDPLTQAADADTTLAGKRVSYLRGSSVNEIINGGTFRSRTATKLGDIVGSGPVYVGAPNALYSGELFPGYSAFLTAHGDRVPIIYVGANDGMLHAFQASDGKELFAYVPGYFLQPDSGKKAARISVLTTPAYKHKFFVDASPMVGDVRDGKNWKSILLGAYGAGGKGFYALDITDPSNLTADNASAISLWEKSDSDDADIGYTFNQPVFSPISGQALQFALIPTATGHAWAIIVGNGFGSTNGKAALLFLNPTTGATLAKVVVESTTAANGLATPFPVDTDGDGLIDTIWAGDLQGTMWRIRWDKTNLAWVSTPLYRGGSTQPITSAPFAAPHCSVSGAWNVVFGTGKYIEKGDYNTQTQQALYGMLDTLTSTVSSPATAIIAKTDLVAQTYTDGVAGANGLFDRTYSNNAVNYPAKKGWYIDLHTSNGERSISNPIIPANTGIALLGSFEPPTACMPITGYFNVVDACTGGGATEPGTGNTINGRGGEGLGIPYISNPVSSASKVVIPVANGAPLPSSGGGGGTDCDKTPEAPLCIHTGFNSGVRASWRELR